MSAGLPHPSSHAPNKLLGTGRLSHLRVVSSYCSFYRLTRQWVLLQQQRFHWAWRTPHGPTQHSCWCFFSIFTPPFALLHNPLIGGVLGFVLAVNIFQGKGGQVAVPFRCCRWPSFLSLFCIMCCFIQNKIEWVIVSCIQWRGTKLRVAVTLR